MDDGGRVSRHTGRLLSHRCSGSSEGHWGAVVVGDSLLPPVVCVYFPSLLHGVSLRHQGVVQWVRTDHDRLHGRGVPHHCEGRGGGYGRQCGTIGGDCYAVCGPSVDPSFVLLGGCCVRCATCGVCRCFVVVDD